MTNFDSLMARIVYEGPIKEYVVPFRFGSRQRITGRRAWNRLLGLEGDRGLIKTLMEQAGPKLDAYERILSKQKYLAGNVCIFSPFTTPPTLIN